MKAVVFHGIGDIRLDDVDEPCLRDASDAIVRVTASAICGTDLHMVRGTLPGMKKGTVLGHEAVGVVEELGRDVRNFRKGDRVVVCSTIGCGACPTCTRGHFAQCLRANPNGLDAGTAFFGGPASSGPFDGLQAEYARVPFASVTMVRLPDEIGDDQAILLSDIFPTGWFGVELGDVEEGQTVAVFGCGPVGQFAVASARLHDAGRIFAVDCIPSRLEMARAQGAEVIDFSVEDPVEALKRLTHGAGVDCAIDAVGVDAVRPHGGPAARALKPERRRFDDEVREVAPRQRRLGDNWHPGDAPSLVLEWAVESLARVGTLAVIGVYGDASRSFPVGAAMEKNLTVRAGNCNHRRYVPTLVELVQAGVIDPSVILTQREPLVSAIDAYKAFDTRQPGWVKVMLEPARLAA